MEDDLNTFSDLLSIAPLTEMIDDGLEIIQMDVSPSTWLFVVRGLTCGNRTVRQPILFHLLMRADHGVRRVQQQGLLC